MADATPGWFFIDVTVPRPASNRVAPIHHGLVKSCRCIDIAGFVHAFIGANRGARSPCKNQP